MQTASKTKAKARRKAARNGKKERAGNLSWGGHYPRAKRLRDRLVVAAVTLLAVGGLGYTWWQSSVAERGFQAMAAEGVEALAAVESSRSRGRRHLRPGETHHYRTSFPTSGPHAPTWTVAGFYDRPQPAVHLVHALEHGNVVIYYDQPGDEAVEKLRDWSALYDGRWDGLVVARAPNLADGVVLTAWTKKLELERFDAAAVAAFIDAYRGRGPENPVR